jgi:hypothetical protein
MIKVILFCILSLSIVYGQVVEGVDYSDRAKVYKTFDMYREDVFGQRFFSENVTYKDKVTGVTVNALTTSRRGVQPCIRPIPSGQRMVSISYSDQVCHREIQEREV